MRYLLPLPLLLVAVPAHADRDFCADRPGLTTPACTVEPGRVIAELGIADWSVDRQPGTREDQVIAGDLLLRTGVGATTEVRLGWTAFGHRRSRDFGTVEARSGVGDVTFGISQNLRNPDGSGFAMAVVTEALVPVGGEAIGAGDWGVRLLVPASVELSDMVAITITPEVGVAPDEDRNGRHLRFGSSAGVSFALSDAIGLQAEAEWLRDRDPADRHSEVQAGLFLAAMVDKDWQLDAGGAVGLNRDTPDVNFSAGISHRF
jgi:hypothetical protein